MTTLQDKFNKLYSARAKLEAELNNIYGNINNAVDKQDRKVKIERLIVKCKDFHFKDFTRVVDKNEELFDLAQRTEDPDAACKNLEKWLETVTKKTEEFIAAARGYINSVHDRETAVLYTSHQSRSGSHMTSSKRSSQRQRDLELSRLKREELEAKLRIARQRLEIEKQMKMRELEIEQLEEDQRKEVAAAALEEIELMTRSSADGSGTGKMSGLFTERSSLKSKKLVQDWVNSSPAGNMADVANEPSLHFSGSIAQSNQAIVQRPSSTQLPNSHSNFNTHGQVEANINLPVHEPQEPSSRNNVTNEAHNANNIMQEQQQPQYTPPSPMNFGMPTQLNAPNTARQLSQATMHFDGLQLDHQFPRRSSMLGQLNLVSPPRSPPLNTLVNAPLALNPQQAHINVPAPHPPF